MELIKRGINHFSQKTLATLLLVLTVILFGLVYFISVNFEIPIRYFTADPLSLFDVNPLIGVISNIGILLWCATTAVLLFTFILVMDKVSNKQVSFLLYVALITGLLLLDDLFMIHDRILLSLGIHEMVMYGIYALLFGILIFGFYKILLSARFKFALIIAFISFGSSVIIDLLIEGEVFRILIEDGFKFLGIVCWSMFYIFYCISLARTRLK